MKAGGQPNLPARRHQLLSGVECALLGIHRGVTASEDGDAGSAAAGAAVFVWVRGDGEGIGVGIGIRSPLAPLLSI